MLIQLGHSPDADDAFMFWALAAGRVDTRGFEFEHVLRDIQTLNEWALEGKLETTAISLHTYPFVQDKYVLLPHGASMGAGYGPIVVAREPMTLDRLAEVEIAIPGRMTTAFLVLRMAIGDFAYRELPFDAILEEVVSGDAEAGLLIHEGQLTYESEGLAKVLDLGEETLSRLSDVLAESIRCGLENRSEAMAYAMEFSRGLEPHLADRFVGMYVNELTQDYGDEGRQAVKELLRRAEALGAFPEPVRVEFV